LVYWPGVLKSKNAVCARKANGPANRLPYTANNSEDAIKPAGLIWNASGRVVEGRRLGLKAWPVKRRHSNRSMGETLN